jgi:hypothetical protein
MLEYAPIISFAEARIDRDSNATGCEHWRALLALLSISCGKTKAPAGKTNEPRNSATAGLRSPTPLTVEPSPAPSAVPPASATEGFVADFPGEVSRGQRFEKAVAPGLVFRLEPYAGNDSGWDIRLAPGTEASAEAVDCIGAIETPSHGSNELAIELPEGVTASEAALRNPHEFDFVPNSSDCKRAWDLNNSINYQYKLTDQQREELNRQLGAIPTAHGHLKVLDFRLGAPPEGSRARAIEWIKFEVALQFPQPANPTLAKAASSDPGKGLPAQAEREIPYSPPSAFAELPAKVRLVLQSRGCRIPQTYEGSGPHNVIQGRFATPGQSDWAVLCSKERNSSILIFWNGSDAAPAEIHSAPDSNYLTPLENGKAGFSRAISRVGKDFILEHYKAYGGPAPPPLDHDGINDEFLEKGSTVHYFYRGQWLMLTGSD